MEKLHALVVTAAGVCATLASCHAVASPAGGESSATTTSAARSLRLPATFVGSLPCADCESVRWHLDLWLDQAYHLRRSWVGRDLERDELGRWRVDPGRNALVLYGAAEMPLQFDILAPDRLRLLDTVGGPIQSTLAYELVSDGTLRPVELKLTLGGEMTYIADAARFTECLTGRSYPMAMEGDFVKLERAYRAVVEAPGARLYVTFDGSIVDRPRVDRDGVERTVVVTRFSNAWPGQRCERARANAALSNTYWRIVRLGDVPVSAHEGHREPHVILRGGDGRTSYSATVGCNPLAGTYSVDGHAIRFAPSATTLVSCPPPLDVLERTLGATLAMTASWSINAGTLEFFDAAGQPLALFEAVYL